MPTTAHVSVWPAIVVTTYAAVDCRKRNKSVPLPRFSISRIRARKTASLVTTDSELSARALTLMSALAATSVLDFARENDDESSGN